MILHADFEEEIKGRYHVILLKVTGLNRSSATKELILQREKHFILNSLFGKKEIATI